MPRKPLQIPHRIEALSILSAEGCLDTDLEPRISAEDLAALYRTMLTSRRLDERCLQLQRQGRMGTFGPSKGQEAASLGCAYALQKDDWLVPSFRESAALIWRGWPLEGLMLWWGGYEAGNRVPEGINDLPQCVPVASQCQYGMGIAWGCKLKGTANVCTTFCGDGGTSEGDFHEAMNFAGVYNLPLIMFIQNNHWAISVPRSRQTASQTLSQKAIAYGFDGMQVDGNDLLAVIVSMREAVEKARTGGGPTLIEAVTYRLGMHTTADDPKKYRTEEEVKLWEKRDPLLRFRKYLSDKGLLSDEVQRRIDREIDAALEHAVKRYLSATVDPLEFFQSMYAEKTPELVRQEAELRAYLGDGEPVRAVQPDAGRISDKASAKAPSRPSAKKALKTRS